MNDELSAVKGPEDWQQWPSLATSHAADPPIELRCGRRVVLGASSPALLSGLQLLLNATAGVQLKGSVDTREKLLALCSQAGAEVALVDAALCASDARAFVVALRERAPRMQVLLVGEGSQPHLLREALKGGACGFVSSTSDSAEIADALAAASAGRRFICAGMSADLATCLTLRDLTTREQQVLEVLARGECNKVIARELDVTVGTIKTHVRSIMVKLQSHGRTEALLEAHRLGLVRLA